MSFAAGALSTVGLVWLRHAREQRRRARVSELPYDADEAARADALHDIGDAVSEVELTEPMQLEPIEMKSLGGELSERTTGGERYDAVDPEELGAEWLQRAVEATPRSPQGGTPTDPASGSAPEQLVEPADVAAEIPVGSIDTQGNTELHEPAAPAGPLSELLPTDQELEQRRAAHEEHPGPGKPHG
jgi:hypothetical protein